MIIGFTGHRPNAEGMGGYNWDSKRNKVIREETKKTILDVINIAIDNRNETEFIFIVGGALGFDQFVFDIVYKLKQLMTETNIKIEIAVPFKNQSAKWFNHEDIERYNKQLQLADNVVYVDTLDKYKPKGKVKEGEYSPAKLILRNHYMVDKSDIMIACYNGNENGGTFSTIKYCKKTNTPFLTINPLKIIE